MPSTSAAVSAASGLVAATAPVAIGCQRGAAVGSSEDAQGSNVAWTPDGGHWSGM